jgi:hypothetical protein
MLSDLSKVLTNIPATESGYNNKKTQSYLPKFLFFIKIRNTKKQYYKE